MLERLTREVDGIVDADVSLLCDSEIRETLVALNRQLDRLEAGRAGLVAAAHHRMLAAGDGASSTPVWLQSQTGMRHADAKTTLAVALAVESLPLTAKAWRQGEISASAARSISRGRRDGFEDVYGEIEATLVDFAAVHDFGGLDAMIRHYQTRVDALDDVDPAELNDLHLSRVGDRWAIGGDLDDLTGSVVDAAVNAAMDKPTVEDTRTPTKRRADALGDVCRFFLDHKDLPVEGGEAPHAVVIVNWETIANGAPAQPGETPLDLSMLHEFFDGTTFTVTAPDGRHIGSTQTRAR